MKFNLVIINLLLVIIGYSQGRAINMFPKDTSTLVNWYTFEEARLLFKKNPKKLLVNIFSTSCGWCKKMDKEIFTNKISADYINKNFYPIKLDIKFPFPIIWQDNFYQVIKSGKFRGQHEMILRLFMGTGSTPYTVIINENGNDMEKVYEGYLSNDEFITDLKEFGSKGTLK